MEKNRYLLAKHIVTLLVIILFLAACVTTPEDIPSDLSPQLFFREAQENIDLLNWDVARLYLNEFKNRYPDNRADTLAADYQLAVIAYKQNQYRIALSLFEEILNVYDTDVSSELHEWVQVLSEDFIVRITELLPVALP